VSAGAKGLYIAEPPAQYIVRPPVVIDCSVFAALVFREDGEAEALTRMAGRTLHAPYLMTVEMTSVAQKKLQLGASELAREGLVKLEEADIIFHATNSAGVFDLAVMYQLTAYDANYLWLAAELKCPLLTFDARLGKAAIAHLNSLT
jgi:predicted nucleic acid-binding protein